MPHDVHARIAPLPPRVRGLLVVASASLAGCDGPQSALDPQGPVAASLAQAWWVLFAGGVVIFVLVLALALYAVLRPHDRRTAPHPHVFIIGGGVVLPVVVLTPLLLYGFHLSGTTRPAGADDALRVEVIGRQWWWEVRYGNGAVTANEIHIPVGRTVEMRVTSADVIHSFWVPNLAGKIDMMPGSTNVQWLRADRAGVFRGQCAEFCGAQHARMALLVIAEPEAEFARWRARQAADAAAPAGGPATQGFAAFARLGCPECHTIRGVAPGGRVGPDLTHVASRRTLAAVTLQNDRASLAAWVADAPRIKPGTPMPSFAGIDGPTREHLLAFLESLQ